MKISFLVVDFGKKVDGIIALPEREAADCDFMASTGEFVGELGEPFLPSSSVSEGQVMTKRDPYCFSTFRRLLM